LAVVLALASVGSTAAESPIQRVAPGDTLSGIAQLFGVSADSIAQLNDIADPNLILVGQLLRIPIDDGDASHGSQPPINPESYDVAPGDTLSEISLLFNVSLDALQEANQISDPNLIFVGQRIIIPSPLPDTAPIVPTPLLPPDSPELEALMEGLSADQGVDPGLVKAIAWVESGWQQGVVSPAGAVGLMQILPDTGAWLQEEVFGYPLNIDTSAYDNIKAGVRLLRVLLDSTNDQDEAVGSYYQGLGTTLDGILFQDTKDYVATVNAVKAAFWP
jgi:LysM repeat protein